MGGSVGTAGGALPISAGRKLILVVDDDASTRALVARALSTLYDIRSAGDCVAAASELARPPLPDLILLDVAMPKYSGFAFARMAKGDPKYRSIPIIFLTAKTSASDMVRGIQVGARAYVTKPFSIDALRERVATILK
jgi:DNA-binding response OmpR family regulator